MYVLLEFSGALGSYINGAPGKNKIDVDNGIFYDGLADVQAKAEHVLAKEYAGMALWSIENDSKDADKSLIKRINESLGN